MGADKRKRNGVHVDGAWIPMPLSFLRSRACAELSPHALKLLVDLMTLLAPNAGRNGDLWLAPELLEARGWTSKATQVAAMRELRAAGLVVVTRRRSGRRCELLAITLWPLSCDQSKLDRMRVHHAMDDYAGADDTRKAPPTTEAPAVWRKTRGSERARRSCGPAAEPKGGLVVPLRNRKARSTPPCGSAAEPIRPKSGL